MRAVAFGDVQFLDRIGIEKPFGEDLEGGVRARLELPRHRARGHRLGRDLTLEGLLKLSRLDATETPGASAATAEVKLWDVDVARFLSAVAARWLPEATVRAPRAARCGLTDDVWRVVTDL